MNFGKIFSISLATTLLIGCGGGYIKNYGSKPVLGGKRPPESNIIELDGLDLYIRAYNDFRDFEMWNVMLIPVFVEDEDKPLYENSNVFNVLLAFLPSDSGLLLNPEEISLVLDEEKHNAALQKQWDGMLYRYSADVWTGYCGTPSEDLSDHIRDKKARWPKETGWRCFMLQFAVSPPNPSQAFSIIIEGMSKDGEKFEIPIILFEKFEWYDHSPLI